MKKILVIILATALMLFTVGCDLFVEESKPEAESSSASKDVTDIEEEAESSEAGASDIRTEAHGDPISTGDVKITDTYTHTDPEDLEFDHRHVLYCNDSAAMAMQGEPFDVTVEQMYFVLYGGEEKPVACYEYCVFATEEDAAKYVEECASFWTTAKAEGNVSVMYKDSEKIDADLIIYSGYGIITDETCDQYLSATSMMYCYVPLTDEQ